MRNYIFKKTYLSVRTALGILFSISVFFVSFVFVYAQTPGGVSSPGLWLKSDFNTSVYEDVGGTDFAESGDNVEVWKDSSVNNLDYSTGALGTTYPQYIANTLNFYPVLEFFGVGNKSLTRPAGDAQLQANQQTIFAVMQNTTGISSGNIVTSAGTNEGFRLNPNASNDITWTTGNGVTTDVINIGTWSTTEAQVVTGYINGPAMDKTGWVDGLQGLTSGPTYQPTTLGASGVGGDNTTGGVFGGYISEVVVYDSALSEANIHKIHSYLALKYGVTLDNTDTSAGINEGQYQLSSGATVWDGHIGGSNQGFHNDVAALGQDSGSAWDQRVSKSQNDDAILTMATTNDFTSGNEAVGRTSISNASVIMWGNDDGAATWSATDVPTNFQKLTRIYRVQETGTVGDVYMQFDVDDSDFDVPALIDGSGYYLIVDQDNDTTFADETPILMTNAAGSLWTTDFDFTDGQRFTVATSTVPVTVTPTVTPTSTSSPSLTRRRLPKSFFVQRQAQVCPVITQTFLRTGARGESVRATQEFLNSELGTDILEDGIFGVQTESLVRQFQMYADIRIDGVVGPETRAAMNALCDQDLATSDSFWTPGMDGTPILDDLTLQYGDVGDEIRRVQIALNTRGYIVNARLGAPGSAGYESRGFGKLTEAAVKRWQTDHGWMATGMLTLVQQEALLGK